MKQSLNDIPAREVMSGFRGRFVHGENVTLAYWNIEKGAVLPAHSHPNEQVLKDIYGEFELVV